MDDPEVPFDPPIPTAYDGRDGSLEISQEEEDALITPVMVQPPEKIVTQEAIDAQRQAVKEQRRTHAREFSAKAPLRGWRKAMPKAINAHGRKQRKALAKMHRTYARVFGPKAPFPTQALTPPVEEQK